MRYLDANKKHTIRLKLNGQNRESSAEPRMLLVDFLRRNLGITSVHVGCEHGVCGACTIQINGCATRSCTMFAVQIEGYSIKTVESLSTNGGLNPLQEAFRKHHALQCGFCTPGILMSMSQLINDEPEADEPRIRDVLSGHICRCTGYYGIVKATLEVLNARKISKSV